jgi:hypothetical protein
MIIDRLVKVALLSCTFSVGGRAQDACDSTAQVRVGRVREQLALNWERALSEATLVLHLRSAGSVCARREVLALLSDRPADAVQRLLVNVARSDPDARVRMLAIRELSASTNPTPELTQFLGELPLALPRREGIPGVVIVKGRVVDSAGRGVPTSVVALTLSSNCVAPPELTLSAVSEADGSFEAAFDRGGRRSPACVEVKLGRSRARATAPSATAGESSRSKSDTVRIELRIAAH